MNRLRLWILLTALGCFVSGMVIGYLAPGVAAGIDADLTEPDPDEYQINKMVTDFGLSPEQERLLRMIFRARQEEESAAFRRSELEQLHPALRSQIKNARNKAEQRIRMLLTDEQRHRYDEMMSIGNK